MFRYITGPIILAQAKKSNIFFSILAIEGSPFFSVIYRFFCLLKNKKRLKYSTQMKKILRLPYGLNQNKKPTINSHNGALPIGLFFSFCDPDSEPGPV